MCKINTILFKKEWEQLEKYYKKKHTREDANFYYSKLKDLTDSEFEEAIDLIFKTCKYFPNIAEIRELVPKEKQFKEWNGIAKEEMDLKEKDWAKNYYKKHCESKEEAEKRIKELNLD